MKIHSLLLTASFILSFLSQFTFAQKRGGQDTYSHYFEENMGQFIDMNGHPVPNVLFKMEAEGVDLYVTTSGLTYVLQKMIKGIDADEIAMMGDYQNISESQIEWERVDLSLMDAHISAENLVVKDERANGLNNYFLGHCPDGIRDVTAYGMITFKNIYPNIDWVLYNTSESGFKYDFILHPGANPMDIKLLYGMKSELSLTDGKIEMITDYGTIVESQPISFFDDELIASSFNLESTKENEQGGFNHTFTFNLDETASRLIQDESDYHELVIDPELQWGTFFGGSGSESSTAMKADSENNLIVAGYNFMADFPVQSSTGYYSGTTSGSTDLILTKFTEAGVLLWSTYYGGSSYEYLYGFDIDENDVMYCGGYTASFNFPTQDAGSYFEGFPIGNEDAFMLKFNSQGDRLWATFIGGTELDEIRSITAKNGVVYAVGYTESSDFPFVSSGGSYNQSILSGLLDAFILKFDDLGNLLWSTYYGGSGFEQANAAVIDGEGNFYVTGNSHSTNFDTQDGGEYFSGVFAGEIDVFLLKFDESDNRLWATYYGGNHKDIGNDLAVDGNNNLFLYGYTVSSDLPLLDAGTFFQGVHTDPAPVGQITAENSIPFLAKFTPQGEMTWATYYGNQHSYNWRDQHNIAIDECGNLYCGSRDSDGIEALVPFPDGGYMSSWHGQSTRFSMFTNDGELLGATPLCTMSGHGNSLVCVGKNGIVWASTAINGFYPQSPLDYSTLPLMAPADANAYYDGNNDTTDDIFINKFQTEFNDCKIVSNEPFSDLIIPNVFTPNDDQLNDVFMLNVSEAVSIELTISNRWGNLVFNSSGPSPEWDGTDMSGNELADGVYFVSYVLENYSGLKTTGQSFVHLIRDM